ncbi:PEP-CTERM sorting domain-containing protein [Aquincola sp. J276]|uniref:PEP-CTERM sorting domain-containing protein n=1 Tax=Aquincola sp. J276 TaxID=2898432 RepID=UPI0021508AF3|nr:PEP-CTERM sorting domain-containing protein [Aquincola sp. J276]MCR5864078.1 PEP-CTERM sorting domain-containing protein [Aquincola sp. J276]
MDGSFARAVTRSEQGGSVLAESSSQRLRAGATAVVSYSFQVVGPANVNVPVRVQASGYASGTGLDHQATSTFTLERTYNSPLANLMATATSTGNTHGRQAWSVDEVVLLSANLDINVSLSATAIALTTDGPSSATAFADPIFTIDPAFAASYILVGIPSAVPEPGAWGMLLTGAALGGWHLRARSRRRDQENQSTLVLSPRT